MLLILLLVATAVKAQPPGFDGDSIYVYPGEDIRSLPDDIRGLIGSSQYGRPVPWGQYGLPEEGGAGIGEDYADGRIFGVDLDLSELEDESYTPGGGASSTASTGSGTGSATGSDSGFDISQYIGGTSAGSYDSGDDSYGDDDDDSFDLSQYGMSDGVGGSSGSSGPSSSSMGSGSGSVYSHADIDLTQFGIYSDGGNRDSDDGYTGDDDEAPSTYTFRSSSGGGSGSSGRIDLSRLGITSGDSDDGGDSSGRIDLSQFGIYSGDSRPDDMDDSYPGVDDDDSADDSDGDSGPINLAQYGISFGSPGSGDVGAGPVSSSGYKSDSSDDSDGYTGRIDLSQFGIYTSDDRSDDMSDDGMGDDDGEVSSFDISDYSGGESDYGREDSGRIDLSQFGIVVGGGGDAGDSYPPVDDDETPFTYQFDAYGDDDDESDYSGRLDLSQLGDRPSFGSDSSTNVAAGNGETYFDLSQFGIVAPGGMTPYSPYLSAFENTQTKKTPINTNPDAQPTESAPAPDGTSFPELPASLPDDTSLSQGVLGIDLSDFGINMPSTPIDSSASGPANSNSAVEYLTLPESSTAERVPPIVPAGFDVIQTVAFDWKKITPHTNLREPAVQRWIGSK